MNDFDDEAETAEFEETDIQVPVEEEPTETESELPPSLRIGNQCLLKVFSQGLF